MRSIILIFCCIHLFISQPKAQYIPDVFQLEVSSEGDYMWLDNEYRITGGFAFNIWPTEYLGLNYEYQFGYDSEYGFQMNTNWGTVLGVLISDITGGTAEYLALLTFFIPEGVSFAIPVAETMYFIPYINPLEADYLHRDWPRWRCAGEVGMKVHYRLPNGMALRPKFGIRYQYSKKRLGLTIGFGFMPFESDER